MKPKIRCAWTKEDPLLSAYHDQEWGVPLFEDQKLFEFIVLDAFQAGLSWLIILKKREGFRQAFQNYHLPKIDKAPYIVLKGAKLFLNS